MRGGSVSWPGTTGPAGVRLGGLGAGEVAALGRALGVGELPRRAVAHLLEQTGGNPLYCQAVLEEAVAGGLELADGPLGVPRSLAGWCWGGWAR